MDRRYAVFQCAPSIRDGRLRGRALHSLPYLTLQIPAASGRAFVGTCPLLHALRRLRRVRPGPI